MGLISNPQGEPVTGRVILHFMKAENAATAIAQPAALIASAAMPRPMLDPSPHPRGAGTRARVLADDVRECGVLDLLTALRQMSLVPAQPLEGFLPAIRDRGRIRIGADADRIVFDPDRIHDLATFEIPHPVSERIPHMRVGGVFVVRDGQLVEGAAFGSPHPAEGGAPSRKFVSEEAPSGPGRRTPPCRRTRGRDSTRSAVPPSKPQHPHQNEKAGAGLGNRMRGEDHLAKS